MVGSSNKRMRGIAVSRPIIIGSTATPLSDAEKLTAPPDHTHKWTVAVRSAASNPLPTVPGYGSSSKSSASASGGGAATPAGASEASAAGRPKTPAAEEGSAAGSVTPGIGAGTSTGVSTRGRDQETDYHKMVGGKDDLSHFVKRVQFKLHETYPQSTRNIDRPPFQVTETGWGEFDIQIKIFFQPESGEKPVTCFHRLKLHPWHPIAVYHQDPASAVAADQNSMSENSAGQQAQADVLQGADKGQEGEGGDQQDVSMSEAAPESSDPDAAAAAETNLAGASTQQIKVEEGTAPSSVSLPPPPPVVHSWTYDEIVFPEPTEAFYDVLIAHPPTPLPSTSAQAFGDPAAFRSYKQALQELDDGVGRDLTTESGIKPPHPLHNSSGALFDALSHEAILSEAERLDKARAFAIQELEETRRRLIEGEKMLRDSRKRAAV